MRHSFNVTARTCVVFFVKLLVLKLCRTGCHLLLPLSNFPFSQIFASYYQETMKALGPLFESQDPAVVDNVCGAFARMILNSINSVPVEHVS